MDSEENIASAYFTVQRKGCMNLLTNSHLDLLVLILVFEPRSSKEQLNLRLKSFEYSKDHLKAFFSGRQLLKMLTGKVAFGKRKESYETIRNRKCHSMWKNYQMKGLDRITSVFQMRTQAQRVTELSASKILRCQSCKFVSSIRTKIPLSREILLRVIETQHLRDEGGYREYLVPAVEMRLKAIS